MEQWVLKLNEALDDYVCKNWTRVKFNDECGYFARFTHTIGLFVSLDKRICVVGLTGKMPTERQMNKVWKGLIKDKLGMPIRTEHYAPFGLEFENQLPFVLDEEVIELQGEFEYGD